MTTIDHTAPVPIQIIDSARIASRRAKLTALIAAIRDIEKEDVEFANFNNVPLDGGPITHVTLHMLTDDEMKEWCVDFGVAPTNVEHDQDSWLSAPIEHDGARVKLLGPTRPCEAGR